jgi:hypothetical protein
MDKIQRALLLLSLYFGVFFFRAGQPKVIESVIEYGIFFFILALAFILVKEKEYWMSYILYILCLFYNPYFLIHLDIQEYGAADVAVTLLLGMMGILWHSRSHGQLSETRAKFRL